MNFFFLCLLIGVVVIVVLYFYGRFIKKCEFCCFVILKSLFFLIFLSVLELFKIKSKSILFFVFES